MRLRNKRAVHFIAALGVFPFRGPVDEWLAIPVVMARPIVPFGRSRSASQEGSRLHAHSDGNDHILLSFEHLLPWYGLARLRYYPKLPAPKVSRFV